MNIRVVHQHCPNLICAMHNISVVVLLLASVYKQFLNATVTSTSLLLRSSGSGQPVVGKYCVSVPSFEEVALPALREGLPPTDHVRVGQLSQPGEEVAVQRTPILIVVDEIGKMELFSRKFEEEARNLFDQPLVVVLATVPLHSKHRSLSLVDQLVSRKDVNLYEVSYALSRLQSVMLCMYTCIRTCSCAFSLVVCLCACVCMCVEHSLPNRPPLLNSLCMCLDTSTPSPPFGRSRTATERLCFIQLLKLSDASFTTVAVHIGPNCECL